MTLLVYSVFGTSVQTTKKSTAFIMIFCLSVGIYHSGMHCTVSRHILYRGLCGNLSFNTRFGGNRSNISAITTTTSQSHVCGQDQVPRFVLRLVQYRVHFHSHVSEWRLLAACVIMRWSDTNSPIRHVWVCICTHSRVTDVFRYRLTIQTKWSLGSIIIFHIIL